MNGLKRAFPLVAFGFERKIDHHDRVLLHDTDQQDDADQRDDAQIVPEQDEQDQRADPRGRQRGQDGDRVDVALVEHAQHDVDHQNGRGDEQRSRGQRGLERLGGTLEGPLQRDRRAQLPLDLLDMIDRLAERIARRDVERQRHRRELALMVDGERLDLAGEAGNGAQRHSDAGIRASRLRASPSW